MIADAIKDVSNRNGIVLDLFGGSGSTLIAAHKTGRRGFLCELDPLYCDRIIRRWQVYARDDAILERTGRKFEEVERDRINEPPHVPTTGMDLPSSSRSSTSGLSAHTSAGAPDNPARISAEPPELAAHAGTDPQQPAAAAAQPPLSLHWV